MYTNNTNPFTKRLFASFIVMSLCLMLTLAFSTSLAFADETTTVPPTTISVPDPQDGLDSDLPGATTIPVSQPSPEELAKQEQAKRANSKFDKVTKNLLETQLAADQTAFDIQTTKATLLDVQDKITKNEILLAIQILPTKQLSKIVQKRAVIMYESISGSPTDPLEEFIYKRQNVLSSKAQSFNVVELNEYNKQVRAMQTLKNTLIKQKSDAQEQQVKLEVLSIDLNKKLETVRKEYGKAATDFIKANGTPGVQLPIDGKMCPIAGPITHVDDFGNPRSGGRTHKGNDIFNAFGTPNVAIVSGYAQMMTDRLGGTGVMLQGNDGNTYYYAHLSAWAGQSRQVIQGEVIGYSGDTGNAKGGAPHTHFEIRMGGTQHIDPYATIRIICGA